jgi:isovaleryl-CoA dehydrogenase
MDVMLQQESPLFNPTPEHAGLRDVIRKFSEGPLAEQAREGDESEKFNIDLFRRLGGELGILGLTVSEQFGGAGMDAVAEVILHEEMSRFDPAFTLSVLAHEVLFVNNLFVNGNDAQRKKYLPQTVKAEKIGGMCMTEPGVGTDVLGLSTVAVKKADRYVLNGSKAWITNGYEGSYFLVYAKMDSKEQRHVTKFIVEKDFPGFRFGKKEEKMGMRASSTAVLYFEDLEVPEENLVGTENKGLVSMMRNLEIERIALAAQSLGIAQRCIEVMARYAIVDRQSFGRQLIEHGQIQRLVSESYADWLAARTLVYHTAGRIRPDERNSIGAAAAKLVATQMAERVGRNAIQVLGVCNGYSREYPVERLYRDAVLLSIGGGTNEAMQKNIAADLNKMFGGKK